jgi:hypothetical protein
MGYLRYFKGLTLVSRKAQGVRGKGFEEMVRFESNSQKARGEGFGKGSLE